MRKSKGTKKPAKKFEAQLFFTYNIIPWLSLKDSCPNLDSLSIGYVFSLTNFLRHCKKWCCLGFPEEHMEELKLWSEHRALP